MIVQCESCQTRFHVADARIPEKGARVRCSRCHHRFHITPSSAAPNAQPSGEEQGSASEPPRGEAPRPAAAPATGRKGNEDELDNPEFLFDEKSGADSQPSRADIDAAAQALREPVGPPPQEHMPHGLEHEPAEERVVASGGKTAQEMLDAGAPVLSQTRFEIGGDLIEDEAADDETGTGTREFTSGTPTRKVAASAPPARAEVDALGGLDDDDESSFAGWDPLSTQGNDAPQDGAQPAKFFDLASAIAGTPEQAAAPKPASVFDQPDLATPAAPKKRAAPDVPVFDPEAPGAAAFALRAAAWTVGLGLILVAARGLWLRAEADFAPPELVRADGWVAADLETFLARDALGERVLVVRGNLMADGATAPPQVFVRVLGRNGEVLAEAPRTWLERIDDAEVAPDALSLRLASASAEVAARGQQVTGFTAVLPDPPPGSRRVEIALQAAAMSPRGTATANTPPEPVPSPPSSQAAPIAPPTEHATPSAPPVPVPAPAPSDADVIPAAPDVVD